MKKKQSLGLFSILFVLILSGCKNRELLALDNLISENEWHKATDRVVQHHAQETKRDLAPYFLKAQIDYPPKAIAMLAFKKERRVELWAKNDKSPWRHIKNYPLKAFSGHLGPKTKRNDGQIPEGIYKIASFNPYSAYHLSMMLNYPNAYDRYYARLEGRRDLGDNIFIHGKALSAGCLAVGDHAIDELFTLVNKVGKPYTEVIIAPNDMRKTPAQLAYNNRHKWVSSLYKRLSLKLHEFQEA